MFGAKRNQLAQPAHLVAVALCLHKTHAGCSDTACAGERGAGAASGEAPGGRGVRDAACAGERGGRGPARFVHRAPEQRCMRRQGEGGSGVDRSCSAREGWRGVEHPHQRYNRTIRKDYYALVYTFDNHGVTPSLEGGGHSAKPDQRRLGKGCELMVDIATWPLAGRPCISPTSAPT